VPFRRLEAGVPLLVQRWSVDLPEAPDGVAVRARGGAPTST
jgi:hypothetical protein